jgi:hypothetical protein
VTNLVELKRKDLSVRERAQSARGFHSCQETYQFSFSELNLLNLIYITLLRCVGHNRSDFAFGHATRERMKGMGNPKLLSLFSTNGYGPTPSRYFNSSYRRPHIRRAEHT